MRIDVNKHWRVYLDLRRADSLSLLLQITAYVNGSKSHALHIPTVPVYKKYRIASLLCIFETTISLTCLQTHWYILLLTGHCLLVRMWVLVKIGKADWSILERLLMLRV